MTTLETEEVKDKRTDKNDLLYKIDDTPPWYICILLGFQVTKKKFKFSKQLI